MTKQSQWSEESNPGRRFFGMAGRQSTWKGWTLAVALAAHVCSIQAQAAAQTWAAVGAGLNSTVTAMTIWNGQVVAGGAFTNSGGNPANRVARFDGTAWQALGTG